jgi:hypothetical protein
MASPRKGNKQVPRGSHHREYEARTSLCGGRGKAVAKIRERTGKEK